jgi:Rod binding domain-containing protein
MQIASLSAVSRVFGSEAPDFRAADMPQIKSPLVQFEAFVLQDFVAAMLPEKSESVFGKGLSGDMWKSLFAEKIAAQMADRGGIGIADRLLKDFHIEGDERLSPQSGGGA